jgi:uncharacterized SAM-dependent methyltransferase
MSTSVISSVSLLDLHPAPADLRRLVEVGLQRQPKQLPAWLLYDDEGSRLFDLICEQPEYSLTRIETALLAEQAHAIAASFGYGCLVEFGAGSARKVSPLLRALQQVATPQSAAAGSGIPASGGDGASAAPLTDSAGSALHSLAYVALDISAAHLAAACRSLAAKHANLPILGICCDYSVMDALPDHPLLRQRRLGFYPGSSIGNFAWWEAEHSRIAMALISQSEQTVRLAGSVWSFAAGEPWITEYSVKYSQVAFAQLARQAGWEPAERWSDPSGQVALVRLVPA